jgi:hypothetical protein
MPTSSIVDPAPRSSTAVVVMVGSAAAIAGRCRSPRNEEGGASYTSTTLILEGTWASATTASWSGTTPWARLFMRVYALGSHGSSDASPGFVQSSRKRFRCLDGRANQRKFNFGHCSQG